MAQKILIADDETKIVRLVADYLAASGFETIVAGDGAEALAAFRSSAPDCLVLDVNMPGLDGLSVAREVRKSSEVPIVFLSARVEETDRVVGLELGADDYVAKPFSPRELVARVRAILRRSARGSGADPDTPRPTPTGGSEILRRGPVVLDFGRRLVTVDGEPRELTTAQFDILALLARQPGRVYPRALILEKTTGSAYEGYERTVDAHIKNIRKALGDDSGEPRFIGTVRGVGYRFIEP